MPITSRSEKSDDANLRCVPLWSRTPFFGETQAVTITLNHFSAALVFSLFASVVFGITHRDTTREMVRYGLYCFAMFLGGVLVAGWAMWILRR